MLGFSSLLSICFLQGCLTQVWWTSACSFPEANHTVRAVFSLVGVFYLFGSLFGWLVDWLALVWFSLVCFFPVHCISFPPQFSQILSQPLWITEALPHFLFQEQSLIFHTLTLFFFFRSQGGSFLYSILPGSLRLFLLYSKWDPLGHFVWSWYEVIFRICTFSWVMVYWTLSQSASVVSLTPWEEGTTVEKLLHWLGLCACLWGVLLMDVGGPSPLWVIPSVGR